MNDEHLQLNLAKPPVIAVFRNGIYFLNAGDSIEVDGQYLAVACGGIISHSSINRDEVRNGEADPLGLASSISGLSVSPSHPQDHQPCPGLTLIRDRNGHVELCLIDETIFRASSDGTSNHVPVRKNPNTVRRDSFSSIQNTQDEILEGSGSEGA